MQEVSVLTIDQWSVVINMRYGVFQEVCVRLPRKSVYKYMGSN